MIKLTETIVKRPIAAIIIIAGIIIFGAMSIFSMPQELTPDMEMPMLIVSTIYPGAGPEDVEKKISKEIEDSAGSLSGVRRIMSNSMENVSIVIIQYEYGIDIKRSYTDLKERLDGLANILPAESRTPIIMEIDMNASAVMTLSVSSETKDNLLQYVNDEIIPQLDKLSSVSSTEVSGGQEEYVRVEVREEMLREYGITMSSVVGAVSNVDYSAPLGRGDFGDTDIAVRIQVSYDDIDALRNIPITLRSGDVIRLADVANIYIASMDAESISRYNGNENISIGIQKRQTASADRVSADVMRAINAITESDPDITITVINDNSERIASSIMSVAQTLILAIILSMIVLYVFLGDIRACLIVGSSMPVSLLITFILMNFMGYTLNIVSMSGLVIGVGMMTDNAIVVVDSCFKSKTEEKTFAQAAVDGIKFVMLSLFAVTLTTVVVFLPLAMIQGMSGQMFGPLGFSIIFALTASLFSAITLVPLFFVQFKPVERENTIGAKFLKKMELGYGKLLDKVVRRKKTVAAITLAILTLSVYLATFINFELMPAMDEGVVSISVEMKPGLKLENADEILLELEEMVAAHPDVEHYSLSSGSSGGGLFGGGGASRLTVYLHKNRNMQTDEVIEQWRQETRFMLDCDINISSGSSGGMASMGSGDSFDITLQGDDLSRIKEAAFMVEELIEGHPDIIRVNSSIDRAYLQAQIAVDPLKAASKGLTPQMITGSVYTALNGSKASDIRIDRQNYAIRVEYPRGRYETVSDVTNMMVVSPTGASVPLTEIASIIFTDTPQTITRDEGLYVVTVTGIPTNAAKFTAQSDVEQWVNDLALPDGVSIGESIQAERMNEEFASLGIAIVTAILLVFMVMAIQFESIRHSIMVMLCIPFALIGSLLLMYLTGTTISMVSLLGFLILIGMVVNNGILFVDTTNRYRETMDLHTAIVQAGQARLRPILMITLTTILAMIPLASGIGQGTEMMQGLGITVIGGLTASTILALLLLPTFYLIIDGNPEKRMAKKQKRIEKREAKLLAIKTRYEPGKKQDHVEQAQEASDEQELESDQEPICIGQGQDCVVEQDKPQSIEPDHILPPS